MIVALNSTGCRELPFVEAAAQTYFDYLNGAAGYVVFVVGAALLLVSMVSRKQLGKAPGWLSSIVIVALILGSLPAVMSAFGINLGCDPDTTNQTDPQPESEFDLIPDVETAHPVLVVAS